MSGTVILTGASGSIGSQLTKCLVDKGYSVVRASSRSKNLLPKSLVGAADPFADRGEGRPATVTFQANFSNQETHKAEFWQRALTLFDAKFIVNAAGGAVAPLSSSSCSTLRDINHYPVVAMAEAIESRGGEGHFIQLSSMAARKARPNEVGVEYVMTKRDAEQGIDDTTDHYTLVSPDLVFANNANFRMRHPFSPDEVAALPSWIPLPIVGSGRQTLQPVAMKNVVDGLFQIIKNPNQHKRASINFVGPDIYSQIGLLSEFRRVRCTMGLRPMHIGDPESDHAGVLLLKLAKAVPIGSFNPSLIQMLLNADKEPFVAGFSTEPFQTLLGSRAKLIRLRDVLDQQQLTFERPPIKDLVVGVLQSPEATKDVVKLSMALLPRAAASLMEPLRFYTKGGDKIKNPVDVPHSELK